MTSSFGLKFLSRLPFRLFLCLFLCLFFCACSSEPKKKTFSDEERVPLLLDLASANLSEGDATGALTALHQARKINDKIPEGHYLFALAYAVKNEPQLALESARRAIQLKPNYSQAQNTVGKLLLDQNNFDEAEKHLLIAARDLTSRDAHIAKTNLGVLHYKKMNLDVAEKWLNEAIVDGGNQACVAFYYRGEVYYKKNELLKAQENFKQATRGQCSKFSEAHLAAGKTLIRMKKYEQARAKLVEVQQLFPDSQSAVQANLYLKEIP